ncbi:hypothetical protein Tco_0826759 [Tanacetum coccineum]
MSLQALTNLHDLFSGFLNYFWSRKLRISNFGPANRKILPMMIMYSCVVECPKAYLLMLQESGCEMNCHDRDDRDWYAMSRDYFFDV